MRSAHNQQLKRAKVPRFMQNMNEIKYPSEVMRCKYLSEKSVSKP